MKNLSNNARTVRVLSVVVVVLFVALLVGVITPAVVLSNRIKYNQMVSNMRAAQVEEELMDLFMATNSSFGPVITEAQGIFTVEVIDESRFDLFPDSQGTYQVIRTPVASNIDIRTLVIQMPQDMPTFSTAYGSMQVDMAVYDFQPPLFHRFHSRAYESGQAYVTLTSANAIALGLPCVLNNTCIVSPNDGPMPNEPNLLTFYFPSVEFLFKVEPASALLGTVWNPSGDFRVNLGLVYRE